jgi:5-methylcytosine-specific restriction endonuclease McrA
VAAPIPKPTPKAREPKPLTSKPHVINRDLAQRVFTRDNWTCQWCERPGGGLDPHHRLPRGRGGKDTYDNLVSVHRACHRFIHANPHEAIRRGFTVEGAL